ncbi:MAG: alpha/beta hydrolase family protein [Candidatus Hermodarchaeota archaeon]
MFYKIPRIYQKAMIISVFLFFLGVTLMICGTFNTDENLPIRISFNTYPQYTNELNSFFNRTEVTALEDAQNKLIEDYRVAGYVILPKTEKPPEGYPVLIWIHGFAVSADMQMNFPRQFAKSGFLSIVLDQPGHGWSGGYWDMGIQTMLGIYSTVEWLVNDSNYKDMIDVSRMGVSGHSMGGIATTRAGIFDNWINPKTGRKIGTGLISSWCAVFCWDNPETMIKRLVENYYFGKEQIWSHPTIIDMMKYWRWFSNYDPSTFEEEMRIRSVSNFINASNINNYCLIIGSEDEFVSVESQCHIMANATINSTGIPQVPWNAINDTIHTSANHTWNFGNITNDNARRLVLVPGTGHIGEAISREVLQNITYWFNESMNCIGISPQVPEDFQVLFIIKNLGWILAFVGSFCAIIPSITYISTSRSELDSNSLKTVPKLQEKEKKSYLGIYATATVFLMAISGLFRLNSITHFWMYDILIPKFLLSALFLLIPTIIMVFFEKKRQNYQCLALGLNISFKNILMEIFIPIIAISFWIMLFNTTAWIFQVPLLLPRPFEIGIYLDFITLLGILLLFNFNVELLFRGLYQTKIQEANNATSVLIIIGKSSLMSGVCLGIGFGTNILITYFGLFMNMPIIFTIGLYGVFIVIFVLLGVIAAEVYRKTGSIISSSIFNALIMALFIAGKLWLSYA